MATQEDIQEGINIVHNAYTKALDEHVTDPELRDTIDRAAAANILNAVAEKLLSALKNV